MRAFLFASLSLSLDAVFTLKKKLKQLAGMQAKFEKKLGETYTPNVCTSMNMSQFTHTHAHT